MLPAWLGSGSTQWGDFVPEWDGTKPFLGKYLQFWECGWLTSLEEVPLPSPRGRNSHKHRAGIAKFLKLVPFMGWRCLNYTKRAEIPEDDRSRTKLSRPPGQSSSLPKRQVMLFFPARKQEADAVPMCPCACHLGMRTSGCLVGRRVSALRFLQCDSREEQESITVTNCNSSSLLFKCHSSYPSTKVTGRVATA